MTCRLLSLASLILGVAACLSGCASKQAKTAQSEVPIIPVSVPVQKEVTDHADFTGRTDAVESVDIRARVTGYLVKTYFKDGAEVKEGDLLFEIDARPYQAQLDQAESQVKLYQAQLKLAKATLSRDRTVSASAVGAVSPQQLEQDVAQVEEASARVRAYEASTEIYKLNLDFTKVRSPINGQVSRSYLSRGNLVNQDQTLMTTVVALDPVNAYFDLDEPTLLRLRQAVNEGKIQLPKNGVFEVFMGLGGEEGYPHKGEINFVNNQVNPTTGSISMRGVFRNPIPPNGRRLLSPGMFVRIRMPIGQAYKALLVADQAIASDQGLKYVYLVDSQNKVQYRRIRTGPLQADGLRVIEGPRYKVTDPILKGLREDGLPVEVSDKLATLKDREIPGKDQFREAVSEILTKEEMEKYGEAILKGALLDGLFPEDRVVVGGLQQVRPRVDVKPDLKPMPTQDTPPAARLPVSPSRPQPPVKGEVPKRPEMPKKGGRK